MKTTWEKLEAAFEQCLDLSGDARKLYLKDLADHDPDLFFELNRLLAADDQVAADSFFEPGSLHGAVLLEDRFVGQQIGTFTLTELIGEGGMGAVYRAEQIRPFKRQAAFKIIRVNHTNDRLQRRFDVEVQTLARLNHPNIASVYFSGTTDEGLPFFCMELVKGLTLDAYCRRHRLPVEQRLHLFVQICRAVHYAHQRGVIHRDLKPGNILITEQNGEPQAKIIDFGIAKAVQDDNQADHSFQVTASQLTIPGMAVGTLGYMSPEQTLVHDGDVDLRTDVYALGVILYEMLVGDLPIHRERAGTLSWDQTFKAIREEQPKQLSRAVLNVGAQIAEETQTDVVVLSKKYRGDLDAITAKALEKEPDRRYESAQVFAEDIERHLANEPVLASPPSLGYQVNRFVKRNKILSASIMVVFAALLVAVAGLGAGFYQAKQSEERMQREIETANTTIEVLEELIVSVSPRKKGSEVKLIDLLYDFSPKIEFLNIRDEIRADLYLLVGRSFRSVSKHKEAIKNIQKSKNINTIIFGAKSFQVFENDYHLSYLIDYEEGVIAGAQKREKLLRNNTANKQNSQMLTMLTLAQALHYIKTMNFTTAKEHLHKADQIRNRFLGENRDIELELEEARAMFFFYKGDYKNALTHFQKCLEMYNNIKDSPSGLMPVYRDMATAFNELGYHSLSDKYTKSAIQSGIRYYGSSHPILLSPKWQHCHNLLERGDNLAVLSTVTQEYNNFTDTIRTRNPYLSSMLRVAEEAARESKNSDIFLPIMENYILKEYNGETRTLLEVFQLGTFGVALFSKNEKEASLPVLLQAYEISNDLNHPRKYSSAIYSYYISRILTDLGKANSGTNWACTSISHFERVQGSYNLTMFDIKSQWVTSLVKSDYPDGAKELDTLIEESADLHGINSEQTVKLVQFREDMSHRLRDKAKNFK